MRSSVEIKLRLPFTEKIRPLVDEIQLFAQYSFFNQVFGVSFALIKDKIDLVDRST